MEEEEEDEELVVSRNGKGVGVGVGDHVLTAWCTVRTMQSIPNQPGVQLLMNGG